MTTKKGEGKKKPKKSGGDKLVRAYRADLPHILSDAEALMRGRELAQVDAKIREEEVHATAVKEDLKARMSALVVDRGRLAYVVRMNQEPRPTQVEGWARVSAGIYEEVRLDTGEVLERSRRRLTDEERQDGFDFEDPTGPAPNAEKTEKTIGKKKADEKDEEDDEPKDPPPSGPDRAA